MESLFPTIKTFIRYRECEKLITNRKFKEGLKLLHEVESSKVLNNKLRNGIYLNIAHTYSIIGNFDKSIIYINKIDNINYGNNFKYAYYNIILDNKLFSKRINDILIDIERVKEVNENNNPIIKLKESYYYLIIDEIDFAERILSEYNNINDRRIDNKRISGMKLKYDYELLKHLENYIYGYYYYKKGMYNKAINYLKMLKIEEYCITHLAESLKNRINDIKINRIE